MRIARALVEERVAACVNVVPGAISVYRWKGQTEESTETMLIVKSSRALFPDIEKLISRLHSYELPEILALPIAGGSEGYLKWLAGELLS